MLQIVRFFPSWELACIYQIRVGFAQLRINQRSRQFVIFSQFPVTVAGYLAKNDWISLLQRLIRLQDSEEISMRRLKRLYFKTDDRSEDRTIFIAVLQGHGLQQFHVSLLQPLKSVLPMSWEIPFLPQRSMLVH